jgi:hypothetical protein
MSRRARVRLFRSLLLALIAGGSINFLIAQAIAYFGFVHFVMNAAQRFVAIEGKAVVVESDMHGPGWRYLYWIGTSKSGAAVQQYMYDNHLSTFGGLVGADYFHADAPRLVPAWATLWNPANWRRDLTTASRPWHTDIAVGWPVLSYCMDRDTPMAGEVHGGVVCREFGVGELKLVAWRPIFPAVLIGTVFWGALIVGSTGLVQFGIDRRRRRLCRCRTCGYSREGLAAEAVCPECGTV